MGKLLFAMFGVSKPFESRMALMTEAVSTLKTSANVYQTTRRNIPEEDDNFNQN
jgi:hypothetical protein